MNVLDVIRTKRDGGVLSDEQIRWFIEAYTHGGEVADEQASALLMAIVWRGMTTDELVCWTEAMITSGERMDLSGVGRPTVDKHSTGGVGDKASLVVVPMVAAIGGAVPQLSGRGLGHTGGTLDKMEAIHGWHAGLVEGEMATLLDLNGGVIAGATSELCPADRKLYALRDVTGTVESVPLIASSIMSKKIAEGADSLVLDVKVGRAAFLPSLEQARVLARTMVDLGNSHGVRTRALLTDMDQVLGSAAGNGLEVTESLEVLSGAGPSDVAELSVALAREMSDLAGLAEDPAATLTDGRALAAFEAIVAAQGGDLSEPLPTAAHVEIVIAERAGVVTDLDPLAVGLAAWRLGAGRAHKEDPVSATAGVICLAKAGAAVEAGDPILELHTDEPELLADAREALVDAIVIGDEAPDPQPLVLETIA